MRRRARNPKRAAWLARKERVRRRLERSDRPRLTVYRSGRHTYAMLVDGLTGRTLAATSTRSKQVAEGLPATGNVEAARRVGRAIAEIARAKQIDEVVFNRNGFLYHGRVKAVADAAREAGLRF
jgi:large subunit ribosomal protein L18